MTQSDGGGRSGVYLAIDANMELAEEEDSFDVFGYLKKLRQSRRGLIENLVQQQLSTTEAVCFRRALNLKFYFLYSLLLKILISKKNLNYFDNYR